MGLNDLLVAIKEDPNAFLGDEQIENKVLRQVLQLVEDKISEVKNQAVKWCVHVIHKSLAVDPFLVSVSSSRSSERIKWTML